MIFSVTVKPNSKKGPLLEQAGTDLTVFLREKPVEGEANAGLIKLLSKHFDVPKTSIIIKAGAKSKHKRVEIPVVKL